MSQNDDVTDQINMNQTSFIWKTCRFMLYSMRLSKSTFITNIDKGFATFENFKTDVVHSRKRKKEPETHSQKYIKFLCPLPLTPWDLNL